MTANMSTDPKRCPHHREETNFIDPASMLPQFDKSSLATFIRDSGEVDGTFRLLQKPSPSVSSSQAPTNSQANEWAGQWDRAAFFEAAQGGVEERGVC